MLLIAASSITKSPSLTTAAARGFIKININKNLDFLLLHMTPAANAAVPFFRAAAPRLFRASLFSSALLATTAFGMMLSFAIVVMPGLGRLKDDGAYLRAFQVIDSVIQDGQPVFIGVWLGAILSTLAAAAIGWSELAPDKQGVGTANIGRFHRYGLCLAAVAYLATHATTMTQNVPLNNRVQSLGGEIDLLDAATKTAERVRFERPWKFWNWTRTVVMGNVATYLLWLLSTGIVAGGRSSSSVKAM